VTVNVPTRMQVTSADRLELFGPGIEAFGLERRRHFEIEGWTPEHDDEHRHAELLRAASAYIDRAITLDLGHVVPEGSGAPLGWPWDPEWWKPTDEPRGNLRKAGALLAAEYDRLDRQASQPAFGECIACGAELRRADQPQQLAFTEATEPILAWACSSHPPSMIDSLLRGFCAGIRAGRRATIAGDQVLVNERQS
jgi:hypothetical protein